MSNLSVFNFDTREVRTLIDAEFIRQQWRMWIETPICRQRPGHGGEFIRQQWRMWIETAALSTSTHFGVNSFASNGECGLKQHAGA